MKFEDFSNAGLEFKAGAGTLLICAESCQNEAF